MGTLTGAWKLARRQMRSGLSGFRIFFICLALGVAAIAGVQSLSSAFLNGLAEQGRLLLGGDVAVGLVHRAATSEEIAFLSRYGRISETVSMRAMAYALGADGHEGDRQLVELKAVDTAYPLYGSAVLVPSENPSAALRCGRVECGAVAEQTFLDRLHLRIGGVMRVGVQNFRITAILQSEPDRISGGFSLGPHVLISTTALPRTGLVQIGSLINYAYRVRFNKNESLRDFRSGGLRRFPNAGWEVRTRENAAPGILAFVEQVTMFLTLVGLAVLAIGGVGAGQAIGAFLDRKRDEIAILKSLGADSRTIFLTFFFQVMAVAIGAIAVGAVIGAVIPFAVEEVYAARIPLPADYTFYFWPLVLAALFGLLSAISFSVVPLARAGRISPAGLFRDLVAPSSARSSVRYVVVAAVGGGLIFVLALFLAPSPLFAAEFLIGALAVLSLLRVLAGLLRLALTRFPHPRSPLLRLAFANLTRPGSTMPSVVTALGLGLALLATVVLLDETITVQVKDALPQSAPTFFFVDIQPNEADRFDRTIAGIPSATEYRRTPMIRGRITALKGVPAKDATVASDSKWVLAGDRGITYSARPPEASEITSGQWWPPNYAGPTLVSFDGDLATGLGLKIGDTITLNVLGRTIEGRIANFRHVNFRNGRQNFILVLSPGLIDKAPHAFLATVRVAERDEEALYRAVTDRFPNISTVRVKDAIAQVNALLTQLALGTRAASLVTILAGLLVLAGAIAAGGRDRLYDATVLKVLGATRARILTVYVIEYGMLGLLTGVLALGFGTLAASSVARWMLEIPFVFDISAAAMTIAGGIAATLLLGLLGALTALSSRPAERLRAP